MAESEWEEESKKNNKAEGGWTGEGSCHGKPRSVPAPDSAVVGLVSVVVLFSHGLKPLCVDHKQMLMTFLTAVCARSHQCCKWAVVRRPVRMDASTQERCLKKEKKISETLMKKKHVKKNCLAMLAKNPICLLYSYTITTMMSEGLTNVNIKGFTAVPVNTQQTEAGGASLCGYSWG